VVAVTDATGKVVDRYNYDSWGEPIGKDYQTVPQQVRYAGYWYDSEVQWYWLSVRYYDPEEMRFLQPDPSDEDGVHTYAYVGDDPVDATDPSGGLGHMTVDILGKATFRIKDKPTYQKGLTCVSQ
jgi:RHS repeat-associated protein